MQKSRVIRRGALAAKRLAQQQTEQALAGFRTGSQWNARSLSELRSLYPQAMATSTTSGLSTEGFVSTTGEEDSIQSQLESIQRNTAELERRMAQATNTTTGTIGGRNRAYPQQGWTARDFLAFDAGSYNGPVMTREEIAAQALAMTAHQRRLLADAERLSREATMSSE